MTTFVLSKSVSFERHLKQVTGEELALRFVQSPTILCHAALGQEAIALVHAASYSEQLPQVLQALSSDTRLTIGVAADHPKLEEMLRFTQFSILAYFNSYMAQVHYEHLLDLLKGGQAWFLPGLLNRAFELALQVTEKSTEHDLLDPLTPRECEIAYDVAQGLSNKHIANMRQITESTVKTHLTRIFKKLRIADRTSLAIRLTESA